MHLLDLAAVLAVAIGVAHSVLGEKYVLRRIERLENLPRLILGGRDQMAAVLRFAWHITTIAWFGLAGLLVLMAHERLSNASAGVVIGVTFLVSAVTSGVASKGRHYSWVVFLVIGAIALQAAVG